MNYYGLVFIKEDNFKHDLNIQNKWKRLCQVLLSLYCSYEASFRIEGMLLSMFCRVLPIDLLTKISGL